MREVELHGIGDFWKFTLDAAWDQHRRHPEIPLGECLKNRSFLQELLEGRESQIFRKICSLADRTGNRAEIEKLFPEVEKYTEHLAGFSDTADEFIPGRCFRFDVISGNRCYFHIRNPKSPESFLDYPEYVAENLRYIMDKAEKDFHCSTLFTASWLNSHPVFLGYFCDEYRKNISDTPDGELGGTTGWQGQFINRAGKLNRKTADHFLKTGKLLYPRVMSYCSFEAERNFLKSLGL